MNEFIFLFYSSILSCAFAFRQQHVGVVGKLVCGDRPIPYAQLRLIDDNLIGADEEIATGRSTAFGQFNISGSGYAWLKLNVKLKITHDCGTDQEDCRRYVDIPVPDSYVTRSNRIERWFDTGALNLSFRYPNEEKICGKAINKT